MALLKKRIADGVSLNYLETDKFKTGFLSVNFIAPLDKDSAAKNALIPNILLRGSKNYPNMAEISKKLDYLYASGMSSRNQKRGEVQVFGICASMIDSAYAIGGEDILSELIGVLGDILFNPVTDGDAFDTAYTESEKNNLVDAINAKINNKAYYARQRCIAEMCKDERFGLDENGTVEDVMACTAASVYEQYKLALREYPVEIFFVGKCDADKLAAELGAMFAKIERAPICIPETEVIRACERAKSITEDMPVNQGKLSIGWRTGIALGDAEYPALMMFNEIFGGGITSKLFMNVREKMSLCYYCSSAPEAQKGLLIVSSGIEVDKREVAEAAIFDQLEAVKAGDFNEDELASARLGIINTYCSLSDSARGLESWYLGRILENDASTPDTVIADIERVTREDIIAAANKATLDTVYFLNGTLKGGEDNA